MEAVTWYYFLNKLFLCEIMKLCNVYYFFSSFVILFWNIFIFLFSSTATKNFRANRLNAMNNMNATNVQPLANIYESVASGKDQVTKVLFCYCLTLNCLYFFILKTATEHQENCLHPKKSGAEVMQALEATDATQSEDKKLFATLIELLSYEKIIFNGKSI